MSISPLVRNYLSTDKEQVLNLIRLNTPKYFAVDEENDLIHYLENELELYYVIELNGKIVGSGGINFAENKSIGKLSWDILHPDFQGKSLGSLLVKHRVQKLKSIKGIKTSTVRTSQLAYKFYEKQGFSLLKISKDYWAEGFDLYHLKYID